MEKTYSIEGIPVAQGRPRFSNYGGFVRVYDPKKSKDWKIEVAKQLKEQSPELLDGPLSLDITFCMPKPKSLKKSVIHHIKKPDVDNLVKGVKDAMNKLCYNDDSQVVELHAIKVYSDVPGVEIRMWKMVEED